MFGKLMYSAIIEWTLILLATTIRNNYKNQYFSIFTVTVTKIIFVVNLLLKCIL